MRYLKFVSTFALSAVLLAACAQGTTPNEGAGATQDAGGTTSAETTPMGTSVPVTGNETPGTGGGSSGGATAETTGIPADGTLAPTADGSQATEAAGSSGNLPENAQPSESGFVRVSDLLDFNVVAGVVPVGSTDATLLEQQLGSVMDVLIPSEEGIASDAPVYLVVMTTSTSGRNQGSGQLVPVPLDAVEVQLFPERNVVGIDVTEDLFQRAPRFVNQAFPDMTVADWDTAIQAYWSNAQGGAAPDTGSGTGTGTGSATGTGTPAAGGTDSPPAAQSTVVPRTAMPTAGAIGTGTPSAVGTGTGTGTAQATGTPAAAGTETGTGSDAAQAATVTYLRATALLRTDFTVVMGEGTGGSTSGTSGSGTTAQATGTPAAGATGTGTPAAGGTGATGTGTPAAGTDTEADSGDVGTLEDLVIFVGSGAGSTGSGPANRSGDQNRVYVIVRLAEGFGNGGLLAVPLEDVTIDPEGATITVNVNRSQLESAPTIEESAWEDMTGEDFESQVGGFWDNNSQ